MPLYEYQCLQCGKRFEVIQKFSDKPLRHCPKCDGEVEKVLHAPALQFKGSGWYVTDYGRKKNENLNKDVKASPTKSSSEKGCRDGSRASCDCNTSRYNPS
ncbi:transcriptional regulator [bacterium (candidate division B38) B3_B38]|nr:MAG: transcriptional regulator [bacterium (candidate division B38) B3_B38]